MQQDMIIQNGIVVTESHCFPADIRISNGKIAQLEAKITDISHAEVIQASGKYIFPGIIDAHVHCELPMAGTLSSDDFVNGTKAAACGGVTTILDFSTQCKGQSLLASIQDRISKANGRVCIDYGLHAGITDWNLAQHEFAQAVQMGITSFKMFMAYRDRGLMSEDDALFSALEQSKKLGCVIAVHAESAVVMELLISRYHQERAHYGIMAHVLSRPDIIEIEAIQRAISWAELSGGTLYIVHTSTGRGSFAIRDARARGVKVYCETCPQYLALDESVFARPDGHLFSSCPQIKSFENQQQLWQSLVNGDVHVVATDHCVFTKEQKNRWNNDFTKLPFGLPGVETLLPILYSTGVHSHKISLQHLVSLLCTNPAKIYGLYPQKGTIQIGSDADLVIFDPAHVWTLDYHNLQTNCDWSPYQGMNLTGFPSTTISRGKIIAQNGKFIGEIGYGRFLPRGPVQHLG